MFLTLRFCLRVGLSASVGVVCLAGWLSLWLSDGKNFYFIKTCLHPAHPRASHSSTPFWLRNSIISFLPYFSHFNTLNFHVTNISSDSFQKIQVQKKKIIMILLSDITTISILGYFLPVFLFSSKIFTHSPLSFIPCDLESCFST